MNGIKSDRYFLSFSSTFVQRIKYLKFSVQCMCESGDQIVFSDARLPDRKIWLPTKNSPKKS